jgi:hypothetical protein
MVYFLSQINPVHTLSLYLRSILILYFHIVFLWRYSPNLGLGLPPWNSTFHFGFLDLRQSVGLLGRVISSSQGLYLYTNTEKHTHTLNIHALGGIGTNDPGFRASEDSACLRPLGYRDRISFHIGLGYQRGIFPSHFLTLYVCLLSPLRDIKLCRSRNSWLCHRSNT